MRVGGEELLQCNEALLLPTTTAGRGGRYHPQNAFPFLAEQLLNVAKERGQTSKLLVKHEFFFYILKVPVAFYLTCFILGFALRVSTRDPF